MTNIENEIKEYLSQFNYYDPCVVGLIHEVAEKISEICKPQWKDGSDILPLVDGAQYIVKKDKEQHWCEICTWNETYQCWDDEEGDDIKYDSVDLYLEIPEQYEY